jgi:diguanylate cyclase (GGDEF)-like protein
LSEPEHKPFDARGYAADKIRAEQLELLIDQSYPAAYMSLVVAGLLVMILWPAQDHRTLLFWLGAAAITGLLRIVVFLQYWRWPPRDEQVAARERAYLITMVLYFGVWGVGSLWIMPHDSPVHQVVVSYFLIGMAGSAIAVFSANRLMLLCAIAILLIPSLGWFFSRGDLLSIGMAAGGTAFLLSAIRSSRVLSRAMRQNLRLKHRLIRAKSAAENLARVDELTGLANRRAFYETAESMAAQSRRLGTPLSLIALDVDYFKKINDSHGHLWGDNALQHLAKLMTTSLRSTDVCGRIGGEEFAILLPGTPLQDALAVAETLRKDLAAAPLPMPGGELVVTASLGVTEGNSGVGELMQQADTALYLAKANGRNRVEPYQQAEVEPEEQNAVTG